MTNETRKKGVYRTLFEILQRYIFRIRLKIINYGGSRFLFNAFANFIKVFKKIAVNKIKSVCVIQRVEFSIFDKIIIFIYRQKNESKIF